MSVTLILVVVALKRRSTHWGVNSSFVKYAVGEVDTLTEYFALPIYQYQVWLKSLRGGEKSQEKPVTNIK